MSGLQRIRYLVRGLLGQCVLVGLVVSCMEQSSAVDFLLEAGAILKREELTQAGRMMLSRMAKRREGDYAYLPQTYKGAFTPTLFYGAAGVGYVLLRAIRQELQSIFI